MQVEIDAAIAVATAATVTEMTKWKEVGNQIQIVI